MEQQNTETELARREAERSPSLIFVKEKQETFSDFLLNRAIVMAVNIQFSIDNQFVKQGIVYPAH